MAVLSTSPSQRGAKGFSGNRRKEKSGKKLKREKESEGNRKRIGKKQEKKLEKDGAGVPEEAKVSLKTSKQGLKRSRRITKTRIEKVAVDNQNKDWKGRGG